MAPRSHREAPPWIILEAGVGLSAALDMDREAARDVPPVSWLPSSQSATGARRGPRAFTPERCGPGLSTVKLPLPASSQHPRCRGWLWVPASGPKQGAFSASAASRKPAWGPSPASLCWNLQRRGRPRLLPSSTVGSPGAVRGRSQPSTQLSGGRTNERWLPGYPKGSQERWQRRNKRP